MYNVYDKLKEQGITFSSQHLHGKGLINVQQYNNLLFVSGQGPLKEDGTPIWTGKIGQELTLEEGYQAARETGIITLRVLHDYLGDLNRIEAIVKVLGFVASAPEFYQQPAVMHGFSDLMVEVFGERGRHARSAIPTHLLPYNIPVEIESIFSIRTS